MNIAFVNPEHPSPSGRDHGGIATYIYTMANALAGRGHRVHVLVCRGTSVDELDGSVALHTYEYRGGRVQRALDRFHAASASWEYGMSRGAAHCAAHIHQQSPLDIVEVPEYNGRARAFSRRFPAAVIVHFHTPSVVVDELNQILTTPQRRAIYKLEHSALARARAFKCTSASLAQDVSRRYRIDSARIRVIRNPMTTAPFDPVAPAQNPRSFDMLFCGRLERRKGAELLLGMVPALVAHDQRITLTFAGETTLAQGPDYREAIERTLTPDLRKRVCFAGPLRRRALAVLYRRSSCLLLPSLFDNAPNVLFEAMAAGLPVIAADAGGVNEIIRHNENGLLFPLHNPAALLDCVAAYMNDPHLAHRCAHTARTEIETRYHPAAIAQQTEAFYRSILERGQT